MSLSPRRGVTLIELMIVVAIIALLAALILSALAILRRMTRVAQTSSSMADISMAISNYFDAWPILGDGTDATGTTFVKEPWTYLYSRGIGQNKQFIDLSITRLVKMTGVGTCAVPVRPGEATHIVDFFGNQPGNVFEFKIANGPVEGGAGTAKFTRDIVFRSSAGTLTDKKDDIILHWTADTSKWNPVKASDFPLAPDPGASSSSPDPNATTLLDFDPNTVLPGP